MIPDAGVKRLKRLKSFEAFDGQDEDHRAAHFDGNWGG
jgi:hypothetical protein